MMKKNKLKLVVAFFVVIIIALIVYNCIWNCPKFFEVNAINCISALIVVGVSFFVVQRQTDYRKQKDIFITLLEALKKIVDDEKSYNFSNVTKEEMLMRSRDISTKIDVIKQYAERFEIKTEVDFLQEKFEEYQSVIDNHSTNMELLRQIHTELKRPLNLLSQKIIEMMLNLYN